MAPNPIPSSARRAPHAGVPVLVNFALDPPEQAAIQAVDPRVQIMMALKPEAAAVHIAASGAPPAPGWQRLDDAALQPLLAQAEILFGFRFPVEWLDLAPHLRWVQLSSAGVDHMIGQGLFARRPDLLVTTVSGIHAIPISEHVTGMMIAFARGFVPAMHNQQEARWERIRATELAGQTLGLIGYGPIGQRVAQIAHFLGMKVLVMRRSGAAAPPDDADAAVDRFYGPDGLHDVLGASDYVVLAVPLTPETRGLINAQALATMRPTAVLINIARGALVVQDDLIAALQAGALGGAGLDVTDPEPLPADSPLWHLPNVLITPHIAGSNPHYNQRATALFCDNLRRYLTGTPLRNLVDPARGY